MEYYVELKSGSSYGSDTIRAKMVTAPNIDEVRAGQLRIMAKNGHIGYAKIFKMVTGTKMKYLGDLDRKYWYTEKKGKITVYNVKANGSLGSVAHRW